MEDNRTSTVFWGTKEMVIKRERTEIGNTANGV